ncbi:type II secretion system protein [Paenibacillus albus]|uniref:Type II secretion system protein n=1 Tax=Paenibacillus albus TaxID=2495582 RepID=A0A3Q8X9M6_9BACL|nr:prepilin-type N-terminal cleavage/methylation domain-containing protein [Paenibacillus albus]AZN43340.1 type II secretion system protein [Paenibacillus albus]
MLKRYLKNQKGLTLIELLAVVVILGVIAAIAVPSVFNIMNNSKKDAEVANANQLISSAKILVANGTITTTKTETLANMVTDGVMDSVLKDPFTKAAYDTAEVVVTYDSTANTFSYAVLLVAGAHGVYDGTTTKTAVSESSDLKASAH